MLAPQKPNALGGKLLYSHFLLIIIKKADNVGFFI